MAGSVNKAILIGRVGKDPTTRNTQAGAKVVSFSLATSESWTDRASGERREETNWHNVVVFDARLAEVAEKYVRKGLLVYLEGAIKTRKWQQDGQDRYITEIVLPAFGAVLTVLTPRPGNGGPGDPNAAAPARESERG